jgi:hypothetical protein
MPSFLLLRLLAHRLRPEASVRADFNANYEVMADAIGEGNFGAVFLGRNRRSGEAMVVKRAKGEQGRDCALVEIGVLDGNEHPFIIRLLDAWQLGSDILLVYEHGGKPLIEVTTSRVYVSSFCCVCQEMFPRCVFTKGNQLVLFITGCSTR